MTGTNVIVYDFAVQGYGNSRIVEVPNNNDPISIVLTCAFCDQSGVILHPSVVSSDVGAFVLVDYYNQDNFFNDKSNFKIISQDISKSGNNAYIVSWKISCDLTNQRQTFGYTINTTGRLSGLATPAIGYNLSVIGAQNSLSLYTAGPVSNTA